MHDLLPIVHHESVGIIISCEKAKSFLLQLKDNNHPDPRCRNRYSLWGGRIDQRDGIDEMRYHNALSRELHEEWNSQEMAGHVSKMTLRQVPKTFHLDSNGGTDNPYRYRIYTFCLLLPELMYTNLIVELEREGYNEGLLSIMDRQTLERHIEEPELQKSFLGNLHRVLDYYLTFEERLKR